MTGFGAGTKIDVSAAKKWTGRGTLVALGDRGNRFERGRSKRGRVKPVLQREGTRREKKHSSKAEKTGNQSFNERDDGISSL